MRISLKINVAKIITKGVNLNIKNCQPKSSEDISKIFFLIISAENVEKLGEINVSIVNAYAAVGHHPITDVMVFARVAFIFERDT
jgi:uncharacterized protein (DUF1015 family)